MIQTIWEMYTDYRAIAHINVSGAYMLTAYSQQCQKMTTWQIRPRREFRKTELVLVMHLFGS